jgi:surfactin family lipopeptide synthetase A
LLGAFHALLWVYSGEEDLITGGTSAGRYRAETDNMLGFFLNTIVLRTNLSGNPTFLEVIERGKEELITSLDHDGVPFEDVVRELAPQRDGGVNPFFQVSFSFEPPLAPLQPNWRFTQMDIETGAAKFDLHLELDERKEGIIGRFIYSIERFDRETVQGMLQSWRNVILRVVADPNVRLQELASALADSRPVAAEAIPNVAPAAQSSPQRFAWLRRFRGLVSRGGNID